MHTDPVVQTMFLIFTGAAVLATVALYARQSLLVVYIALGMVLGPWGLGLVADPFVKQVASIGIMFLLFLLGLNLHPQKLVKMFQETIVVTSLSSALFALLGALTGWIMGFNLTECLLVGAAMMFSSTILGLKLLPTTVLHHQRMGELIISVLLLQDFIAIVILLFLQAHGQAGLPLADLGLLLLSLPALILFAYLTERYVLIKLIQRFDRIQEYVFLMAIGWCLGMAQLATSIGLSYEVGAFIAGVAMARSPLARFIAENLKPLRDFFLVLFFFSMGASFNLLIVTDILLPAALLALLMLAVKPVTFKWLLRRSGETAPRAGEIGARLGQISEFSLLIAVLALDLAVVGARAAHLIELSTLISFVLSSYFIVLRYPTPIAASDKLRRD